MITNTRGAYVTAIDGDAGPMRVAPRPRGLAGLLGRLVSAIGRARRRARDRALLAEMPPRLARDVGLTDASRAPMPTPGRTPHFW